MLVCRSDNHGAAGNRFLGMERTRIDPLTGALPARLHQGPSPGVEVQRALWTLTPALSTPPVCVGPTTLTVSSHLSKQAEAEAEAVIGSRTLKARNLERSLRQPNGAA